MSSLYKTYRLKLVGLITLVSTFLFNGCSPAGFAAGAVLIHYLDEQAKTKNSKIYPSRPQESTVISQKPETARTFVQQPENQKTVEKATQAYKDLKWDESARLLNEAINKGELSRSDQSEAYILLGAMAYQQGQLKEAESYFEKSSEIDSSVKPSAELYPPPLIEFYKYAAR